VQQIKTFQAGEDHEVNQWLKENPNIKITNITRIPMHDLSYYGNLLNQWIDIVVVYDET
jgi:hypothetical protein